MIVFLFFKIGEFLWEISTVFTVDLNIAKIVHKLRKNNKTGASCDGEFFSAKCSIVFSHEPKSCHITPTPYLRGAVCRREGIVTGFSRICCPEAVLGRGTIH